MKLHYIIPSISLITLHTESPVANPSDPPGTHDVFTRRQDAPDESHDDRATSYFGDNFWM
ncbi:MAG: hypothetical protein J6M53_01645 [Bacteroidaceae bacterium]|nr:hypothetical protein [Bacteroidaceae bacterium]